jgi:hypothetical protein
MPGLVPLNPGKQLFLSNVRIFLIRTTKNTVYFLIIGITFKYNRISTGLVIPYRTGLNFVESWNFTTGKKTSGNGNFPAAVWKKRQAASGKLQATSCKLQAASCKRRATSYKLQAAPLFSPFISLFRRSRKRDLRYGKQDDRK